MVNSSQNALVQAASWLAAAKQAVVFTGAGMSTESGIPDFRSPGGVWTKYAPVAFGDFLRSEEARYRYWTQKCESNEDFTRAKPNRGHEILAEWERSGRVLAVITQNIDGLHQLAGNRRVLELHGTAREVACIGCEFRTDADQMVRQFIDRDTVPHCEQCGSPLKHATISFGQMLPEDVLREAERLSQECDLMFALGSSLVVTPAANLPRLASAHGARLVIVNREETALDDIADMVIHEALGESLEAINLEARRLAGP